MRHFGRGQQFQARWQTPRQHLPHIADGRQGLRNGLLIALETLGDQIRPVEQIIQLLDLDKLAFMVRALVEVIADQFLRAGAGIEETFRGPKHPAFAIGMREKRQPFLPVFQAIPAYRAIPQRRHRPTSIAADIDRPSCAGYSRLPLLLALFIK